MICIPPLFKMLGRNILCTSSWWMCHPFWIAIVRIFLIVTFLTTGQKPEGIWVIHSWLLVKAFATKRALYLSIVPSIFFFYSAVIYCQQHVFLLVEGPGTMYLGFVKLQTPMPLHHTILWPLLLVYRSMVQLVWWGTEVLLVSSVLVWHVDEACFDALP